MATAKNETISKRELFSLVILHALTSNTARYERIAKKTDAGEWPDGRVPRVNAKSAVACADALIAALNQESK